MSMHCVSTKRLALSLWFALSVMSVGCTVESNEASEANAADPTATVSQPIFNGSLIVGGSCHTDEGTYFGVLRSDGWCCGEKYCGDKAQCGSEYGHWQKQCVDCVNSPPIFNCEGGPFKPVNPPPGGWTRIEMAPSVSGVSAVK
ncbi:MAG: hypothetical protein ACXVEF_07345 [Polyangiales bacterium]